MRFKPQVDALCWACLVCLLFCTSSLGDTVFPGDEWDVVSPESEGIDPCAMEDALAYLKSKCFEDGLNEVLIVRRGRVVYAGPDVHRKHNIYSCTKSFTSTVLGLLIDEGKCSLNSPAWNWEPLLKASYEAVTLRHFATMTSGYNAVGDTRWEGESADWSWTPYDPGQPLFRPGTAYAYWDEAMMMFGRCLTRIAGESLKSIMDRRIGRAIGLGDWQWGNEGSIDGIPINNGCTGILMNAGQLARFGHLFLNEGNWDGQQLIPRTWVEEATRARVPEDLPVAPTDRSGTRGSGSYGYNWWVTGGLSPLPDVPARTYYASGLNHNVCFVVPEWEMVFVRMGDDRNPPEGKHIVWNEFLKRFSGAILKH